MAFSGLKEFVKYLEKAGELCRIKTFVDPLLEISEVVDRVSKNSGKALLFENTGTNFSLLINSFGSDRRMAIAINREDPDDVAKELGNLFNTLSGAGESGFKKISALPSLLRLTSIMPSKSNKKGACQQVIHMNPDTGIFPILKCWPFDGGRYITLPMVHTIHPVTGKNNVGMYRMQVLDKNTTAMHWQRHKTGANHFEAWKKVGKKMPVSVALGGDPVYTYSATAPLPEDIDEYILAGFLRGKKVKMVRCLTNELYVPSDADIVLEGYVDPSEDLVWEGPFGDHTGFYSLADWYPKFHITCITHRKDAVYPATIVGIPPQEDAWLAKVTERIFLTPVKMTIQPEILDFHMPDAGVAHNLVIVNINKNYPGQGMKVINSLLGAGQMMFTKYLIVVSGEVNIRNYRELLGHIFMNIDLQNDLFFIRGPLDVLDHASDNFSFGGKAGVDATVKMIEELNINESYNLSENLKRLDSARLWLDNKIVSAYNVALFNIGIPIIFVAVNRMADKNIIDKLKSLFTDNDKQGLFRLIIAVDHSVDITDNYMVAWQVLGNTDPQRDHYYITPSSLLLDGTIKAYRPGGFPRKWPNVVCSDAETIKAVDDKWESIGLGRYISSPSLKNCHLCRPGKDEINL